MDSVMEEDVTLPGTLSGCSGLVPNLPDSLDGAGPLAGLGNGALPSVSEDTVSPTRARNMKDFENQITELKKENFNLKLRIYFLEERMQQEFDCPTDLIYKTNIELKVEVESLKRELQDREKLLIKASKAVESLAEGGGSEIQRVKEDAQKKVQQVEDVLNRRIILLEEDVKAAQAELEKAFAGTETEMARRLSLENKLSEMKRRHEQGPGMAVVLGEKDRLIEELKLSLKSKEALIQCLQEGKSQMASPDENVSPGELRGLSAAQREEKEREAEVAHEECQKERNRFEERIQALQEDLREKEREIATEKKNSLKRDKAIQGLTMALKSKEKEVGELNSEVKELHAAFAKAREAPEKAQAQKFQGSEDYEAALLEKANLLAELRSENFTKNAENHKLRRHVKKVTQELSDLQQERERLGKDLEAALGEKRQADGLVHDLQREVEKLRNEVNEREKAVEHHYRSLLSESNKKLQGQEELIRRLTESASQADLLPQKFNEKALEAIQQNSYLTTAQDLGFRSEDLITEKCSSQQSPGSKIIFSEAKQQLDYEALTQVLKKEHDIYAHLVKSLQDSDSVNNLQAELSNILALRRQLEQDVLSYRNLKKTLEEQISEIQRREEEPFSFYSDQTSYLSICLGEHDRFPVEHFSQEELKKKVSDLIHVVKELYADNQHLKKTIFDLSCMGFQGDDRLGSAEKSELLASKEEKDTIRIGEDNENKFLSDRPLEQSDKMMEDRSKAGCKNGYLRHTDSSVLEHEAAPTPGCPGDQSREEGELLSMLSPFFNEKVAVLLESRPDILKALRELLLEQLRLIEQKVSGEPLEGKDEESVVVELRGKLRPSLHASSFSEPHEELKLPWGDQLLKAGEASWVELKDASVQTAAMEGDTLPFKPAGHGEAREEKAPDTAVSAEHQPETSLRMPGRPTDAFPCCPRASNRDAKKSRLPILLKPSRSLRSVTQLPATQTVVAQLQGHILELQEELAEFQIRNKQLHQKLVLAEAAMEGRPAPDNVLLNDYETYQLDDPTTSATCKESPSEDFPGPVSVTTLCSKSQLPSKASEIETGQLENIDTSNDTENLKQKVCDLERELEGYRNFLFQLQKHSQCSEAVITVLCGTEGAQDGVNKPTGRTDEEEMTFSSLHQVRYVKHVKILHPLAPEVIEDRTLENLKQQLVEQKCELQKEQNLNMELFSEIHNLQNKFRGLSPSRYDSLVQSQARELSLQRRQIKDSHGLCVSYRQHVNTMVKAFEELLQASDVDHCVAEGFQEQLHQCSQLLEKLEKLFLSGKSGEVEMSTQNDLVDRNEEDKLTYQYILPESPGPSTSHALSDFDLSEKSFFSRDQKPDSETEKTSVVANAFSQDLLMEHLQEIRSLKKRLEESIKANEKLRRQLERQGSEFDQGSTNIFAYGSELHNSLTSEIHFLRKQNQALNTMLAKGSRDKQRENEKLRESLSRKTANLEHLQREYACVRGENERLQREASEKEKHNQQLRSEVCHSRGQLSRVQEELKSREQLLSQNDKLLQSLRVELKVHERLQEERRRAREAGAEVSGEGCRPQEPSSDLHDLLTEIQALRTQLERSIKTNSTLQSRLEEQLAQRGQEAPEVVPTPALQALTASERPLRLEPHEQAQSSTCDCHCLLGSRKLAGSDSCSMAVGSSCDLFDSTLAMPPRSASESPQLSGNDVDSLSCDSGSSAVGTLCKSHVAPAHHLWASSSGHHILGLIEDYDALCKQIGQGQRLLAEMATQFQEAPSHVSPELDTKGPHSMPLSRLVTNVSTVKLILEEAARLLTLLWRASLPTDGQCTHNCEQTGEMKAEITKLHKKLCEQEEKLQNTVRLLHLSKHQEKVIFDQLVVTHKILRKARGNLELRPGGAHAGTPSPSRPGSWESCRQ
ncbi:PREDICTED: CDK5 regulatory subunit-associated protein 2 isoform X2 [Condylura cristata]|uniref:CDK5 regulatory subunit-associated protein 2 isoform X2 n=1 Tax=Condylura cristata TaxID=143302 RepID=UPI0006429BEE|nr:PREDICTED: CDK5 regulatory subunit-associated protein 2 isoform X2 [Condylura cristata]